MSNIRFLILTGVGAAVYAALIVAIITGPPPVATWAGIIAATIIAIIVVFVTSPTRPKE